MGRQTAPQVGVGAGPLAALDLPGRGAYLEGRPDTPLDVLQEDVHPAEIPGPYACE